jgi:hypothetical protein
MYLEFHQFDIKPLGKTLYQNRVVNLIYKIGHRMKYMFAYENSVVPVK